MPPDLLAARGFARTQDCRHAVSGVGVVDMDGRKTPLVLVGVEQRHPPVAVYDVGGVVDIEDDGFRRLGVALAPQIYHATRHVDQIAQVGCVLQPRDRRLRDQIGAALRQPSAGHLEGRVAAQSVEVYAVPFFESLLCDE